MKQFALVAIAALAVVGSNGASLDASLRSEEPNLEGFFDNLNIFKGPAKCLGGKIEKALSTAGDELENLALISQKHAALEGYASDILSMKESVERLMEFAKNARDNKVSIGDALPVAKSIGSLGVRMYKFNTVSHANLMFLVNPTEFPELSAAATALAEGISNLTPVVQELASESSKCINSKED